MVLISVVVVLYLRLEGISEIIIHRNYFIYFRDITSNIEFDWTQKNNEDIKR